MDANGSAIGIGLRQPHYRELVEREPKLDFLEVHSENFFGQGGAATKLLETVRGSYEISLHGVGLSLGSADAIANAHLEKLSKLVDRIDPGLVSEHLCWSQIDGVHFNDLLPIPYTAEALDTFCARVNRVQDRLKRSILVENVAAYLQYRHSEMSETQFLAELAQRTGCAILLDLNNLYVNAVNFDLDALSLIADLPGAAVGQMHLAGHLKMDDCLIDTHGSRVSESVWALYRHAIAIFGPRPTLIEWDTDVPVLDVLLSEAQIASGFLSETQGRRA